MQDPNLQPQSFRGYYPSFRLNGVDLIDSLHAIAVGDSGMILETDDAGATWEQVDSRVTSVLVDVHCNSENEGIIIGVDPSVILVNTDERGWRAIPFIPRDSIYDEPVSCHSYGGEQFRICESESGIYATSDEWQTVDSSFYPAGWRNTWAWWFPWNDRSASGDTLVFLLDSLIGDPSDSVIYASFRSSDGGKNWQSIGDTFGNFIQSAHSNTIAALSHPPSSYSWWPGSVALSNDLGSTWKTDTLEFDTTLGSAALIKAMTFLPDGSMVGIFSRYDSLTKGSYDDEFFALSEPLDLSVRSVTSMPQAFSLYPNPATNLLNFTSSAGSLSLFNPLGRSYDVKQSGNALDISSLPSGVYFVSDGVSRAKFVKE